MYWLEAFFVKMLLWSAETLVKFLVPDDGFKDEYMSICRELRHSINTGSTFTCQIKLERLFNTAQHAPVHIEQQPVEELEPPSTPKRG